MFLGQLEDRLPEDEELVKQKFEMKYKTHYENLGKIPGVLLEDNKRRKLLKDLGVDTLKKPELAKDQEETKEALAEGVAMTSQSTQQALSGLEK